MHGAGSMLIFVEIVQYRDECKPAPTFSVPPLFYVNLWRPEPAELPETGLEFLGGRQWKQQRKYFKLQMLRTP